MFNVNKMKNPLMTKSFCMKTLIVVLAVICFSKHCSGHLPWQNGKIKDWPTSEGLDWNYLPRNFLGFEKAGRNPQDSNRWNTVRMTKRNSETLDWNYQRIEKT